MTVGRNGLETAMGTWRLMLPQAWSLGCGAGTIFSREAEVLYVLEDGLDKRWKKRREEEPVSRVSMWRYQ